MKHKQAHSSMEDVMNINTAVKPPITFLIKSIVPLNEHQEYLLEGLLSSEQLSLTFEYSNSLLFIKPSHTDWLREPTQAVIGQLSQWTIYCSQFLELFHLFSYTNPPIAAWTLKGSSHVMYVSTISWPVSPICHSN